MAKIGYLGGILLLKTYIFNIFVRSNFFTAMDIKNILKIHYKIVYLSIIFCILGLLSCKNQKQDEYILAHTDCGVEHSPYLSEDLIFSKEEILKIRVRFIEVTDDSSTVLTRKDYENILVNLNNNFAKAKINFLLYDTVVYNVAFENISNYRYDILYYKQSNRFGEGAIDIFVYDFDANYYPGIALSIISDAFAVQKPFLGSNTVTHEIGHCLGLYHTHGRGEGYNDGDFVCDTPETPNISKYIDYNCFPKRLEELTEKEAEIIINNYMSYVNHSCRKEFTKDQIDKMRFHIARESLLRNTLIF